MSECERCGRAASVCPECYDELAALYSALRNTLPRLGDGVPATLGMTVFRVYLDSLWEARVEGLHSHQLEIIYTNDASHHAKGSRSRDAWAKRWYSTAEAAKASAAAPAAESEHE